jgi:O-antigen/teichoic acid export membrane protein
MAFSSKAGATPGELTSGRVLARNAVGNLLAQAMPMAAAMLAIPALIAGIGKERFGILTLAWILLGYFSLFDLGLGRALTKMVAERLGLGRDDDVPGLVWTALAMMTGMGLIGTAVLGVLAPWLAADVLKVPEALRSETTVAFIIIALALPLVIGTAGLRGVMEAHQRLGMANIVRSASGVFTLAGPLLVLPFSRSLVPVLGIIFAGRFIQWALHVWLVLRTVPAMRRRAALCPGLWRPLIRYGGWMTVANVVNPLMVQMDRFLVGALVSTVAVAYYTTPYELVTKFWFVSNAMLGVVFPAFATSFAHDRSLTAHLFGRGVKYAFLALFPLVLGSVALAPEVLSVWLGGDFARESATVMRWLALGVLLNGLAQVPSALLQGVGRPDLTAKLHLIELGPYLVAAWFLIRGRGIEGAALAWTARTALDFVLFFWGARAVLPEALAATRALLRVMALALPTLAVCALPARVETRAALLLVALLGFAAIAWRRGLSAGEKGMVLGKLAPAWAGASLE